MVKDIDFISLFDVKDNLFEGNAPVGFEFLVFVRIPVVILHGKIIERCMPFVLKKLTKQLSCAPDGICLKLLVLPQRNGKAVRDGALNRLNR
jgi:hypothetical protein